MKTKLLVLMGALALAGCVRQVVPQKEVDARKAACFNADGVFMVNFNPDGTTNNTQCRKIVREYK